MTRARIDLSCDTREVSTKRCVVCTNRCVHCIMLHNANYQLCAAQCTLYSGNMYVVQVQYTDGHIRRRGSNRKYRQNPSRHRVKPSGLSIAKKRRLGKIETERKTSPQAKRHQPSLLITPITSLFQLL